MATTKTLAFVALLVVLAAPLVRSETVYAVLTPPVAPSGYGKLNGSRHCTCMIASLDRGDRAKLQRICTLYILPCIILEPVDGQLFLLKQLNWTISGS